MVYDTVCDGIDLDFVEETGSDGEEEWLHSTRVKYFTNELSFRGRLKRLFLRKPTTRLGSRIVDLVLKVILCLLYVIRVELDDHLSYQCYGYSCADRNLTLPVDNDKMVFSSNAINWYVLIWVRRSFILWLIQVILSFMTLMKGLLDIYIGSKGTCLQKLTHDGFILDLICTVPFLVTVLYPPLLSNIFIPCFLNCWLVRRSLQKLLNDLHLTRQRFQTISVTLSQQLLVLLVTLWCLIFTTICGIQHIQRGSNGHQLSMFEAMYFVVVTFSTVGYGDISPDTWLGQLFMTFMICLAFAFIPRQVEGITSTLKERKKIGGEYSQRHSAGHRHVVVCATNLTAESIMDFLIEFYAHPKLEDHIVVLLSSEERDTSLQMILKDPKWAHRVIYMRGSALKDIDLKRCRIHEADGCFILTPTACNNRDEADQHTILRSWAVKDFAPKCRQYIQLFKTENKIHVKFADESRLQQHVVCEDEFKYALLANNCLYPGMSTLVTLLLHTTTGEAGHIGQEPWQQVYGRHSRNAVYHIQLCKSMFFRSYSGKSFTYASANAHKRFGVCLVAVLDITKPDPRLQLNPGADYKLKDSDYCFYIAEFKEEYAKICSEVKTDQKQTGNEPNKNLDQISELLEKLLQQDLSSPQDEQEESVFNNTITCQWGLEIARRMRTKPPETRSSESDLDENGVDTEVDTHGQTDPAVPKVLQLYEDMGQESITTGPPPPTLYASKQKTLCHVMKSPRPVCCLEWGTDCEHCTYKNARDHRWTNQLIILAAEHACVGIHNFIVPLRSNFISMNSLSPIILLLNERPTNLFLETIGHFPLVYWIQGKITSIDDLILAGIHKVSHLVIVNHESKSKEMEKTMVDSESVVAVQTILKLFPNTNIITELSQASNIRFMQFQANNEYTRQVSKLERKLKERMSSTLSHIFRLPFAAGQVFSASMLDSLLYQTFVKGYLITFVRLLLGIDAEENSGHLSSIRVKNMTLVRYRTFEELYQGMATTTGEVPIAIYRTERSLLDTAEDRTVNNNEDGKKNGLMEAHNRPSLPKGPFMGNHMQNSDMSDLVRNRLQSLGMDADDYAEEDTKDDEISYVILNPTPKRKLRVGDIVYVVQPSSMAAIPHKQRWNRARSVRVRNKENNGNIRSPRSTPPMSTSPRSTSPTSSSPGSSSPNTTKEFCPTVNFITPNISHEQDKNSRFTVVPSS
ncbi:potassium channel subfamily T member 2-like isoform X1 [Ylistrum balloti]|uniref:potassium channel subfamily T member 2-like isoform X1 n=1 Tax=Ylistrum balloti TaxID=509963 RepID=UPI002905F05B|nr:potassium channel subfamily T member 2-like isoform X1 [Ylistrum balloti]